jgi:uncharacterized protein
MTASFRYIPSRYMWSMGRVGRLILLLFLALVAYLLLKGSKAPSRPGKHKVASDRPAERMVECAHCGVHLPESESLSVGGKHFCSEEHRRLAG